MKITCMNCRTKVNSKATECQKCGSNMKKQKRIRYCIGIAFLIFIILLLINFFSVNKVPPPDNANQATHLQDTSP